MARRSPFTFPSGPSTQEDSLLRGLLEARTKTGHGSARGSASGTFKKVSPPPSDLKLPIDPRRNVAPVLPFSRRGR